MGMRTSAVRTGESAKVLKQEGLGKDCAGQGRAWQGCGFELEGRHALTGAHRVPLVSVDSRRCEGWDRSRK